MTSALIKKHNPIKMYRINSSRYVVARPSEFVNHPMLTYTVDKIGLSSNKHVCNILDHPFLRANIDNTALFLVEPAVYTPEDLIKLLTEKPKFPLKGKNYERHSYTMYTYKMTNGGYYSEWQNMRRVFKFLEAFGHADLSGLDANWKGHVAVSPLARIAFEEHLPQLEVLGMYTSAT